MARSIWARALVVACAIWSGRVGAQEGTVPVTIRSASKQTELQIGAYEGRQQVVGLDLYDNPVRFRDECRPLCTTPCTVQLPPGKAELCTSQSGWVPHHSVDLNVTPAGADVSLHPFGEKPYLAGFGLSLSGAVLTVVGAIVLASWGVGPSPTDTKMVVGSAGMGLGGALLATGIPIAVVYGREGVASMKPKAASQPTAEITLGPGGVSGTF